MSKEFSPVNGELTSTLKLRRAAIYQLHKQLVDELYSEEPWMEDEFKHHSALEAVKL
jgi:long-subunit acyl-CoA synthetase (AMP-forming)